MDPEVLFAWLMENNLYGGQVTAKELADSLCEEFVMRRRNPPITEPFRSKFSDPDLPTERTINLR